MSTEMEVPVEFQNGVGDAIANDEDVSGPEEMGENIENGNSKKELRIIRRAKRPSKYSQMHPPQGSSDEGGKSPNQTTSHANGNHKILPFSKNSRKSRTGRRGLPKKGGGGGKHTWGKPGSELDVTIETTDSHDPNYDSDTQENYKLTPMEPALSYEEFKKPLEEIVLEYFEHGDADEAMQSIAELNIVSLERHKVVYQIVLTGMDHKSHHREFCSILISDLCGSLLSHGDVMQGFDDLLNDLGDIVLDSPEAPAMVGQFLARAVADDCVPPKFLTEHTGRVTCVQAKQALEKADLLLNMKHGIVRLDNVWGVGGGNRPVKSLIKKMVLLLKEYLSSYDVKEATRCLIELEVPHFHHELVYEAIVMVIEDTSERAAQMMVKLLKSLCDAVIVTKTQMEQGVQRVYSDMPDICLDVPAAYCLLERFATMGFKEGVFTEKMMEEMPNRGRKRFVSEGDGGLVKPSVL